jgi:hypothetical protein
MPETHKRNNQLKAAMKQKVTFLNNNGGAGQTPCGPKLKSGTKRPTGHVEVGTNKKS